MTIYYVDGDNGNDGDDGTDPLPQGGGVGPKATLNGAEDIAVVADDKVWVRPGVYREQLTCDVSGGIGQPIIYEGDVTGQIWGVGGVVRITGSDDDLVENRVDCITASDKDYRTFRGFRFDGGSGRLIHAQNPVGWTIEDCKFEGSNLGNNEPLITILGTDQSMADNSILRCVFLFSGGTGINIDDPDEVDDCNTLIQNCIIVGCNNEGIRLDEVFGVTVRNCLIACCRDDGIDSNAPGVAGFTPIVVEGCVVVGCGTGLEAAQLGDLVEDFNNVVANGAPRSNVAEGANSETYLTLFDMPILHAGASQASGFKFPWWFGELSEWSGLRAITGSNEPSQDLQGIDRPATAAKNSWGPLQFHDAERETGTVRTGSVSLTMHDAAIHQIWVPVANESTTISVYVQREANYAGTNPRLIVKQPGQADDVTTDVAAASQWNELTTTLTPAADPPYVVVELQSLNTAVAGNYDVFFDDLTVT